MEIPEFTFEMGTHKDLQYSGMSNHDDFPECTNPKTLH